ncbi:SH3 domain-containing protein [Aquibacillus halophilus]|uniref:SH3 domain-containing protein n=1 Tax=Aquibacillus halophilus TaxID=930132 RepID=A0A6A8D7J2_9BACI|nr:glycosyl hydrolase family 18 protein [Aquibacillus halophilus]MRH41558.1 SH3 domain-containing protein [Aquibacillus halophilus]
MSRIDTHTQTNRKKAPYIVAFLSLLFIGSSITFWLIYPFPSDEEVTFFEGGDWPLIFDNTVLYDQIQQIDGETYLSFSFLKENIDQYITYDEKASSVIVTSSNEVYQMPTDHLNYYLNNKEFQLSFPAIKHTNGDIFVSTSWLTDIYPIEFKFVSETNTTFIYKHNQSYQTGVVIEENDNVDQLRMRTEPTLTAPYVQELTSGIQVTIEEDNGTWYKIRASNGISGYLEKDTIKLSGINTITTKSKPDDRSFYPSNLSWPIHVTWDAIYQAEATPKTVPKLEGVQVLSPTWFHLNEENGELRNYGSKDYVKDAHEKGYVVWGLFSNDFDKDLTKEALSTYDKRQTIISQLLSYSEIYDLDGINLDFENVYEEDGVLLTQFVRELTPLAHEAGLVVSLDTTFISSSPTWSKFYDRKALAETVDYMMVMAYDEHWGSSPVAGSVASLPWVEKNLQRYLEEVPHDKVLLGIPFYTRLWKEVELEDGSTEVSSKALSMDEVKTWINDKGLEPQLDPKTKQHYVEYKDPKEPIVYKMWLENEHSLKQRAELVHKYNLAGIASWSKYFANESAWVTLHDELNYKKVIKK